MLLVYEDREEMQRSMRKAGIREVFIRQQAGRVRVTALIDTRSIACYVGEAGSEAVPAEIDRWKNEHFEVIRGEVQLDVAASGDALV